MPSFLAGLNLTCSAAGPILPSSFICIDGVQPGGFFCRLCTGVGDVPVGISQQGTDVPPNVIEALGGNVEDYPFASVPGFSVTTFNIGDVCPLRLGAGGCTGGALLTFDASGGGIMASPSPTVFFGAYSLQEGNVNDIISVQIFPVGPGSGAGGGFAAPAFTAFGITGVTGPFEVGSTLTTGTYTFTWSTSNPSNIKPNSISIADTTNSVTLASGLANTGSDAIALSGLTYLVPTNQVWTITGTNIENNNFSRTYTVSWDFAIWAGDSASTTLSSSGIMALALKYLKSNPLGDYPIVGTNYKYLAYPDSMGDITSITDPSTGFPIALEFGSPYSNTTASGLPYAIVSVTNIYGVTVNYRLFRTQYLITGNLTFRVS